MCLLSHKLDEQLYGGSEFRAAVSEFLKNQEAKLIILVETEICDDHPVMQLKEMSPEQIKISIVPRNLIETYEFNFMIVDDFGYRFEYHRNDHAAVASFYDNKQKDMIQTLKNIFHYLAQEAHSCK